MGFFRWFFWVFSGWVFYCQPCFKVLLAVMVAGTAAMISMLW
jgi:hypothetical protein